MDNKAVKKVLQSVILVVLMLVEVNISFWLMNLPSTLGFIAGVLLLVTTICYFIRYARIILKPSKTKRK